MVEALDKLNWSAAGIAAGRLTERGGRPQDSADAFFISKDQQLFAVVHGLPGSSGKPASDLTMAAIESAWSEQPPLSTEVVDIKSWMVEAIARANKSIRMAIENDELAKGTIASAVLAVQSQDGRLVISHVGDARAYLIRDKSAHCLTMDHTVLMEMYKAKMLDITLAQARGLEPLPFSCGRYLLTNAIGYCDTVQAQSHETHLAYGDILYVEQQDIHVQNNDGILLCTYGLNWVLRDQGEGEQTIVSHWHPEQPAKTCENLLQAAIDRRAPYNMAMIAITYS